GVKAGFGRAWAVLGRPSVGLDRVSAGLDRVSAGLDCASTGGGGVPAGFAAGMLRSRCPGTRERGARALEVAAGAGRWVSLMVGRVIPGIVPQAMRTSRISLLRFSGPTRAGAW